MMKLQSLLLQEKRRNEDTLRSIQSLLGQTPITSTKPSETKTEPGMESESSARDNDTFSFLQNKRTLKSDREGQNLSTSTDFALSNLPSLKHILEDLQPRLEALQAGQEGNNAKSEWRKERAAFIEKETKRHLEDVRGLELGEQGSVRDGEWQGEGRKVGMEEVEALERVVGLFGDGKGKETRKENDGDRMDES
jgi:kinetochore protein Mis12/MTW1